jgi:hypothetical protein
MRSTVPAAALALVMLIVSACDRDPVSPDRERALADFQPYLTSQLTAADARARFGRPDEETGSGLRIYIYRFDDGRRLWLGFPGDAPILYARLEALDGTLSDLVLRP